MNLINELRELAEDLYVNGYNRYSAAMSKAADELASLERYRTAYNKWTDKTEWMQKSLPAKYLGMHRADALKDVISELFDRLEAAESARRDDYQNWMMALDRNAELLNRLEAAEKAVTEAYQRGYETGQEEVEKERDALRAMLEDEQKEHSYTLRAAKAEAKQVDALRTKIEEMGRLITWVKDECRLYPDSLDEKAFADRLLAAITHPKSGLQSAQPKTSLSSGLHPLETVHFWADVYTHPGDNTFRGHGMAAALLREYAELRAALVAEAKP